MSTLPEAAGPSAAASTPAPEARRQGTTALTFSQAVRAALRAEMQLDRRVVLIGIGVRRSFPDLAGEFGPERVVDTPIAEQGFVAASVGAALMGLRPVTVIGRADFTYPAMSSIANEAAKYRYLCGGGRFRVPLVLKVQSTGMGVGAGSQHAQSVEATFMHIPGLRVALPATPADAFGLFRAAVRDDNPVLFFEHILLRRDPRTEEVPQHAGSLVPLGQAAVRRRGDDVTLVTYGYMVGRCLEAAERLAGDGVQAEVVDLRTLAPWDRQAVLDSVRRTGRLVVVSEDCRTAGAGAEIAATVAEEALAALRAPVVRLAYPDTVVPGTVYGEAQLMIGTADVVAAVRRVMASVR